MAAEPDCVLPGHKVTALVRDKASLASINNGDAALAIVQGQPQSPADIEKAFAATAESPAVVIVTLNSVRASDNPFARQVAPNTLMRDAHANVLAAIRARVAISNPKIVTLQAQGVGDSYSTLFLPVRLLVQYSNLGIGYKDHEQVEKVLRQSGLRYVLARPARFVEGPSNQVHFHGNKGEGIGSFATSTREIVADFLLDAAEKEDWDGTAPVISTS